MIKAPNIRVLVLDGEQVAALAIVRSLGRKGLKVDVGSSKQHSISTRSRYCSEEFIYPDPLVDVDGFRNALLQRLQRFSYSLVVPVTDLTIIPLIDIRGTVAIYCMLAMASDRALRVTSSKGLTCELAARNGVPIPKTIVIKEAEDLDRLASGLAFPLVVKPDRSKVWTDDGAGKDLSVGYAFDIADLIRQVTRLLPFVPVVVQEYVRGEGVGMGLLAQRGEILFAFQYKRLHEVPVTGGGSSYRVSEAIDTDLLNYVSALSRSLSWDGVAMVEFKRDAKTRKTFLMEINGRFWGSLPLAIAAGADFPSYLVDMLLDRPRAIAMNYKINLRCRHLSRDFEWLNEVVTARKELSRTFELPTYGRIFVDCLRVLNPMEQLDTLGLKDWRPCVIELSTLLQATLRRINNKIWMLRTRRRMKQIQSHSKTLVDRLLRARNVILVCSGNIVRSPFSAYLLSRLLNGRAPMMISSAGVWALPGHQAHPNAISAARNIGIDLKDHTSSLLTAERVAEADLILAMEFSQLAKLRDRFPRSSRKTFLLGCLSPIVPLEIPDPVDRDESDFKLCFDQIVKTLEPIGRLST